jgi:transketolase
VRDTFIAALTEHARANPRIQLITGDLGFGVLTKFAETFPAQYLNAGVAEQNMSGVAAGLALEGRNVFTYSIGNFPTLRCIEQLRNDVAYHSASVKVVAVGGGFSYGSLGMSHHATEDIAMMRAIPGFAVFAPCDELETREITAILASSPGPAYLRLDKSKVSDSAGGSMPFKQGKLRQLREGSDVAILGCGGLVSEALIAAKQLDERGVSTSVFSAHTLKPFDAESLLGIASRHRLLVTVEEHVLAGGLGSLVAEVIVDSAGARVPVLRIGLPDEHSSIVGSQEYLRTRLQIDAPAMVSRIVARLG